MVGFFKKLLGGPKFKTKQKRDPARYSQEKEIAQGSDTKKRLTLAKSTKTHQEILYYLAEKDPDPEVRKAVAGNIATPLHATPVLAGDNDLDVRMALAKRLLDLLPDIGPEKHSQLYAFVVQALGTLALDEVLKVRKALSSTLKDHAHTPPKIAAQLAKDIEREVSEPILKFCAALSDEDLIDILKGHPQNWAIEAIAQRNTVSESVSKAVIETDHAPAGKMLLENEGAMITQVLLEQIVERARTLPEWHEPIAMRKNLSGEMAKMMAEFVDTKVRDLLINREDLDQETIEEISVVVRRRIDFAGDAEKTGESAILRVARMAREGRLNEEALSDAMAMRDNDFVYAALAHMMKTNAQNIEKVFEMGAPKAIVSVSWAAGLSMRIALEFQKEMGKVPHKELIYPKDGSDYPLTPDDMRWQLDFLGIKAA